MMHALFIRHRAKPGRRDELEAVWKQHMLPAIDGNDGHVGYFYSYGEEADTIGAFQIYRSREDADAFIRTRDYLAYLEASRPLLAHEPDVTIMEPRWIKGA